MVDMGDSPPRQSFGDPVRLAGGNDFVLFALKDCDRIPDRSGPPRRGAVPVEGLGPGQEAHQRVQVMRLELVRLSGQGE